MCEWLAPKYRPIWTLAAAVFFALVPKYLATGAGEDDGAPAPQIVERIPAHEAIDVVPGAGELRVTFDRDMQTGGYSFCGGGPNFPEVIGKPAWVDKRTIVVKVRLKPDHGYELSLNCPAGQSFRSADGVPLEATPWRFSTAAAEKKRSSAEQKKLNKQCLRELMALLRDEYSYYKLRSVDWKALEKKHREKIVSAKSDRAWAMAVAEMLGAAKDPHLWIDYGGQRMETHAVAARSNFDLAGVKTTLPNLTQRNACLYAARTDDGIGYLLITTLDNQQSAALAQVPDILRELADCKGLILDLRPNGGGNEMLARPIAAWFVEGEKVYAKNAYRIGSSASKDSRSGGNPQEGNPDKVGARKDFRPGGKGEQDSQTGGSKSERGSKSDRGSKSGFGKTYDRTIRGNSPPDRFDGPVAVLMGPQNMSSCEAFLLMLRQGKNVTLVGERSRGSSGNPKPHPLDNGVIAFIPSWKALRPDGTCFEGEGIEPDVVVKTRPGDFKTGDPVLERGLEIMRGSGK